MIRVTLFAPVGRDHRGQAELPYAACRIVCDGCERDGPLHIGASTWDMACARAEARIAGFTERIVRRALLQDHCPSCATGAQGAAQLELWQT